MKNIRKFLIGFLLNLITVAFTLVLVFLVLKGFFGIIIPIYVVFFVWCVYVIVFILVPFFMEDEKANELIWKLPNAVWGMYTKREN